LSWHKARVAIIQLQCQRKIHTNSRSTGVVWPKTSMKQFPQIFENLGATSRFQVSEGWHENHTEDPQTLHATLQNLDTSDLCNPVIHDVQYMPVDFTYKIMTMKSRCNIKL
jgi:hypothetical protein